VKSGKRLSLYTAVPMNIKGEGHLSNEMDVCEAKEGRYISGVHEPHT
jgi:hypothetical protein